MPRILTPEVIAELAAGQVCLAILCEIHFASATSYMWSGRGPIDWNGHTWLGLGEFGTVSGCPETTDTQAKGITLSLSGIPSNLLASSLTETRQGQTVKLYLVMFTEAGVIIPDPVQIFGGKLDVPAVSEGADTSTISITVENALIELNRPRERHYTTQDQRSVYPTDKGFEYVPKTQDWNGVWGKFNPNALFFHQAFHQWPKVPPPPKQ